MNPNPLDEWFAHADDILIDWYGGKDSMHARHDLDLDTAEWTAIQFAVPPPQFCPAGTAWTIEICGDGVARWQQLDPATLGEAVPTITTTGGSAA